MDHRQAMLDHLDAIGHAIAATDPNGPLPGFLAQRSALLAADAWLRGLDPQPDKRLAAQFGITVVALLLALEDVLRQFPEDPPDHPAPRRLGELTGQLLPELRSLLEEPGKPVLH